MFIYYRVSFTPRKKKLDYILLTEDFPNFPHEDAGVGYGETI